MDGWAQGWRVPDGDGGDLVIRYAPERSYVVLLFSGLAVDIAILLLAFVVMARTKLGPETQPELVERPRRRGLAAGLLVLAAAPAWVLGGVPAAAGLLLAAAFVLLGRRGPALWVAGLLLVAAPVMVAVSLQRNDGFDPAVADLLAGTGLMLAIGSILVRSRSAPEPSTP